MGDEIFFVAHIFLYDAADQFVKIPTGVKFLRLVRARQMAQGENEEMKGDEVKCGQEGDVGVLQIVAQNED